MMNVYIGNRESNNTNKTARAPPGLAKPAPEKLAPTAMKKPPKNQTPASMGAPTPLGGSHLPTRFTVRNVSSNVKGMTAVTILTSSQSNLWAWIACRSTSGIQKAAAPSSISLRVRDHLAHDVRIAEMIAQYSLYASINRFGGVTSPFHSKPPDRDIPRRPIREACPTLSARPSSISYTFRL
jgi:hypothetical protein